MLSAFDDVEPDRELANTEVLVSHEVIRVRRFESRCGREMEIARSARSMCHGRQRHAVNQRASRADERNVEDAVAIGRHRL